MTAPGRRYRMKTLSARDTSAKGELHHGQGLVVGLRGSYTEVSVHRQVQIKS